MICSNSGKQMEECTCGYCTASPCPVLNKEQCPARRLWDMVGTLYIVANELDLLKYERTAGISIN